MGTASVCCTTISLRSTAKQRCRRATANDDRRCRLLCSASRNDTNGAHDGRYSDDGSTTSHFSDDGSTSHLCCSTSNLCSICEAIAIERLSMGSAYILCPV